MWWQTDLCGDTVEAVTESHVTTLPEHLSKTQTTVMFIFLVGYSFCFCGCVGYRCACISVSGTVTSDASDVLSTRLW